MKFYNFSDTTLKYLKVIFWNSNRNNFGNVVGRK